ncbi:MAG: CapA family protein [Chloroflexi bacterium]|nr:CapA family protein [Chloroflexota bacterium]
MAIPGREPSNRGWRIAFVLSAGTFSGALLALGAVVYDETGNDGGSSSLHDAIAGKDDNPTLHYSGDLPGGLGPAGFAPAAAGETADLSFSESDGADGVIVEYFVPVASLDTAVDSVTGAQLLALLSGETTWATVGGIGGKPQFGLAIADISLVQQFGGTHTKRYADYPSLIQAAAVPGTGMIAFIPLDLVTPAVSALAVDGVDIVRGRGDRSQWPFVRRVAVSAGTKRGEAALADVTSRIEAKLPVATIVVATGDILQSRCTLVKIKATGDWAAALRGPVGDYLAAADLALGSLDGSIQDIGAPYGCLATTNLTSPPEVMAALTLAGIDEVTVATNHIFDCGQAFCDDRAFLRTLELLDAAGIRHVGGGRNLEEALAPAIFEVNGVRFGVLGFDDVAAYELEATATAAGTAPLDDSYAEENAAGEPAFFRPASELSLARFSDRIRKLKADVDVVVVQVQSGTEDTHTPSPRSIKALRAAVDAGADLVVGNQAHWVQAVEPRGQGFIAYALGNLIFDQQHTPEHSQGYLLEANFLGKRLVNVRLMPYQIVDQYHPEFVGGTLRAKILGDVFQATAELPPAP